MITQCNAAGRYLPADFHAQKPNAVQWKNIASQLRMNKLDLVVAQAD